MLFETVCNLVRIVTIVEYNAIMLVKFGTDVKACNSNYLEIMFGKKNGYIRYFKETVT